MFTDVGLELANIGMLELENCTNKKELIDLYRNFITKNHSNDPKYLCTNKIYHYNALLDFEEDCLFEHKHDDDESYINSILAYTFVITRKFNDKKNNSLIDFEIAMNVIASAKSSFYTELSHSPDKTREHSAVCAINSIITNAKRRVKGLDPNDEKYKRKFNNLAIKLLTFSKQPFKRRVAMIAKAQKTAN